MPGQTLEQLEGHTWPETTYASALVTTVHRLRKKQVSEFAVEDLRIMIGQGVGLPYLIPRAVEVLEGDPFAEGDYYRGDLLAAVIDQVVWLADQPELGGRVGALARRVLAEPKEIDSCLRRLHSRFVEIAGQPEVRP